MTQAIDPVTQAAAYQRMLLNALGDDDPADVQAATPAAVRALVADSGPDLRTRPEPGEWSVIEIVGHMWDGEISSSTRYRWIVAHDRPQLPGYDQDLWVARLRWGDPGIDVEPELLRPFEALRSANVALWRRMPAGDRDRIGIHLERGPESYELTFRLLAGHDRVHLAQARRALAAVRAARG